MVSAVRQYQMGGGLTVITEAVTSTPGLDLHIVLRGTLNKLADFLGGLGI